MRLRTDEELNFVSDIVIMPYQKSSRQTIALSVSLPEIRQRVKQFALYAAKGGHLEFTINLPRIVEFTEVTSTIQKRQYFHLLDHMLKHLPIKLERYSVIEYCKSGHTHLHGYVKLDDFDYVPVGLICDCVKQFCAAYNCMYVNLKKRQMLRFREASLWLEDEHYKAPHLDIRVCHSKERFVEWDNYINKTIAFERSE